MVILKVAILPKIEDLIIKFIMSIYPFLVYNYKCMFGNKKASCFHVLGFDIMLDDKLNPFLLEINSNPSLSIVFDPHENDKKEELKEKEISPVDLYVKQMVVEDCLKIVSMPIDEQLALSRGTNFNSYKILINSEIPEMDEMDLFNKILDIFGKLSGYKFNSTININKFSKLGNLNYLNNNGINRNSADILFKQIIKNNTGMGFYEFIDAIELIAAKIEQEYSEDNKLPAVTSLVNKIFENISNLNI